MSYRKISEAASIGRTEGCPVQIRSCTVFCDTRTDTPFLRLELENRSGRSLATVALDISCRDRDGIEVLRQEQIYHVKDSRFDTVRSERRSTRPIERVRVSLRQVLAYRSRDYGEVIDITLAASAP